MTVPLPGPPRPADPRPTDSRAADPRPADPRATGPRPADPRAADPRPADSRPADPRADVAAAMAGLDGLADRPLAEHVEAYERVHAALGAALAAGSA